MNDEFKGLLVTLFCVIALSGCTFHWVEKPLLPTVTPTPEVVEDFDPSLVTPLPGEVGADENLTLDATPECLMIKGNINAKGQKLYHIPGMRNYNQVKIDESKGEKFFCDTKSAEDAGWVKAGN